MGSNIMYCASKAALDNMTLSLARALAPQVRVLSMSPGLVDTEFVKSLDAGWRDQQTFSTGAILAVDGGRPLN
jgi:3-oxoacyl-[acyl-carrier protein] reductase